MYKTSSVMKTVAYSLILIFGMLLAVITGQGVKYHRLRMQFKRDQEGFKNAYDVANGTSAIVFSGTNRSVMSEVRPRGKSKNEDEFPHANEDRVSLLSDSRDN